MYQTRQRKEIKQADYEYDGKNKLKRRQKSERNTIKLYIIRKENTDIENEHDYVGRYLLVPRIATVVVVTFRNGQPRLLHVASELFNKSWIMLKSPTHIPNMCDHIRSNDCISQDREHYRW